MTEQPQRSSIRRKFRVALTGLVASIGALAGLLIWLTVTSEIQRRASVAHSHHVDLINSLVTTFRQTVAINDYVVAGDNSKFGHYDLLHRDAMALVAEVRAFVQDHEEVEFSSELLAETRESAPEPGEVGSGTGAGSSVTEDALLAAISKTASELYQTTTAIASLPDPIRDPLASGLIQQADSAAVRIVTMTEEMHHQAELQFAEVAAQAEEAMRVARWEAVVILLVALCLSGYVLVLLSLHVVTPLVQFSGEIEEIRNVGDLEKRVALRSDDELGRVATEFNSLLQRLHEGREALARSREWVRTFDAISDLVFLTDDKFRIVAAIRAMAKYVGIDPDAVTGMKCSEAFQGCQQCLYPRMVEEDREVSAEIDSPELGSVYELTVTPLRDESGGITGSVHVARDITERKTMQAELLAASRLAVLGGITAGVAHEIGNPLASMSVRLRLLEKSHDLGFVAESTQLLQSHIGRISQTLRGIEHLARPATEEWTPRQVNAIVTDAMIMLRLHSAAKNSEIRLELADDLSPTVEVNDQLMHVFLNLGLNALEAMSSGGTLTVRTSTHGNEIQIAFVDTGVGMSDDVRAKMFNPLFSTKKNGMGLGLSIVQNIVAAHRGRIEFESETGHGTSCAVMLPVHPPLDPGTSLPFRSRSEDTDA